MDDLSPILDTWPVPQAAAAVIASDEVVATGGDLSWSTRLASISKLMTAYAGLVAIEEHTIELDMPAGRPGATIRHLLSHAAGYGFDGAGPVAGVGERRIYSNTGIELFADTLAEAAGMPFDRYLNEAVFAPLGMGDTSLQGSPAHAVYSPVSDLIRFAVEVITPTLVGAATLGVATAVQFPDLAGVVPGVGRFDPNPWGLGFEIKGDKQPHWTGSSTSPETYGHFGGAGTFLWVDPVSAVAVVALTNRDFDIWAMQTWPGFSDEMIRRYGEGRSER